MRKLIRGKWYAPIRKALMLVIAALLFFQPCMLLVTTVMGDEQGAAYVTGMTLFKKNPASQVLDGDTVSSGDAMEIVYTLALGGTQGTSSIPVPAGLALSGAGNNTLSANIGGITTQVAQVSYDSSGAIINVMYDGLAGSTVNISFPCALDMNAIGAAPDYTFNMAGVPLNISILENAGNTPVLTMPSFENAVSVADVLLYKKNLDGTYTQLLGDGSETIDIGDTLKLDYDFSMSDAQVALIRALLSSNSGTDYKVAVPLPDGVTFGASVNIPLYAYDNSTPYKFAELIYDSGSDSVYIRFTGEFWDTDFPSIASALISIEFELSQGRYEKGDTFSVNLGQHSFVVIIEPEEVIGNVSKTGKFNSDTMRFEWTVVYTPGEGAKFPITFLDEFTNTYHRYVDGTMKANGVLVGSPPLSVGNNGSTTSLSLDISETNAQSWWLSSPTLATDTITFTYETALTVAGFNTTSSTSCKNTAKFTPPNGPEVSGEGSATVTTTDKTAITKALVYDKANNKYSWTVTVDAEKLKKIDGITKLELSDKLPKLLMLDKSSIKVYADGVETSYGSITGGDYANLQTSTFTLELPKVGGVYADEYKITYDTAIDPSKFEQEGVASFVNLSGSNTATVKVYWENTTTTSSKTGSATIGSGTGSLNTHIVTKSVSYDKTTGKAKWTITVNPNGVDLKSGKIKDDLSVNAAPAQTFLPDTYTVTITPEVAASVFPTMNNYSTFNSSSSIFSADNKKMEFEFGALGTSKAVITVYTKLDDPNLYAVNNTGFTLKNLVNFEGTTNASKTLKDTYNPSTTPTVTVLSKASKGYNYETKQVSWEITVNSDKLSAGTGMDNVTLKETIPAYQSYAPGTLKIDGIPAGDPIVTTNADGSSTLSISLGNIEGVTAVVTLNTDVDVDGDPRFKNFKSTSDKTIVLRNDVTLERDGVKDVSTYANCSVDNSNILIKKGEYVSDENRILYTVNINRFELDLSEVWVTDTIPDGLALDIGSIALYKATYGGDTKKEFTPGEKVDSSKYTWEYNNNILKIKMLVPDCYVLNYDCYIVTQKPSYTNSIEIDGQGFTSAVSTVEVKSLVLSGFASVGRNMFAKLNLTKLDGRHSQPLEGITFELWSDASGVPARYATGQTDQNGQITFSYLAPSINYWLVETAGIDGFNVGTAKITADDGTAVTLPAALNGSYTFSLTAGGERNITVTNDPNMANVSFIKVSSQGGRVLSGATFTLTSVVNPGEVWYATSTSNGVVTFAAVPFGDYTLKEVMAPSNHILNTNTFYVTVNRDQGATYVIKDSSGNEISANSGDGHGRIVNTRIVTPYVPPIDPTDPSDPSDPSTPYVPPVEPPVIEEEEEPEIPPEELPEELPEEQDLEPEEEIPIIPPAIPLEDIPVEQVLHPAQLPAEYSAVEVGDNMYVIYDDEGVPLGYVVIPEGMTLDDIDIMDELIPYGVPEFMKENPVTGDWMQNYELNVLLALILLAALCMIERFRLKVN